MFASEVWPGGLLEAELHQLRHLRQLRPGGGGAGGGEEEGGGGEGGTRL